MARDEQRTVRVETRSDGSSSFLVPENLEFVKIIGAGSYSQVAAFRDCRRGEILAVKKIRNAFHDVAEGKRILREVKLLTQLRHPNLVEIRDILPPVSPDFEDIYIAMHLMESDLHAVVHSRQKLLEDHHRYFMYQILRGLVYLHAAHVVHRDLKPSNILVNKDCKIRICDLGWSRVIAAEDEEPTCTDYVVSRWYRAPEVIVASMYTVSIDVWAAGCILAELIARRPLFNGRHHLDQIRKILAVLGKPSDDDLAWLPLRGVKGAKHFFAQCATTPPQPWRDVVPGASSAAEEVLTATLRFHPGRRVDAQGALRMAYFDSLFQEEDLRHDTRVTPVDWSFDDFEPTKELLQNYLYLECARFHPEIVARDLSALEERSRAQGSAAGGAVLEEFLARGLPEVAAHDPDPELVIDPGPDCLLTVVANFCMHPVSIGLQAYFPTGWGQKSAPAVLRPEKALLTLALVVGASVAMGSRVFGAVGK